MSSLLTNYQVIRVTGCLKIGIKSLILFPKKQVPEYSSRQVVCLLGQAPLVSVSSFGWRVVFFPYWVSFYASY